MICLRKMAAKKQGDKGMGDAATAPMAATATAPDPGSSGPINVTLVDEAATSLHHLSQRTGMSIERLLETSITLLNILSESKRLGRRVVLTTKLLWPIREVKVP
jgi:hypothetical protein